MTDIQTTPLFIPSFTWAEKPSNYVGWARITDVGFRGSDWYGDGTKWSHDGLISQSQKGTGWIVHSMLAANASTYSKSGTTVTVTSAAHGLTANYNGQSIYQILDGVGEWLTGFTYISANSYSATSATSATVSGVVNSNTAEVIITDLTITVKGALLGNSGILVPSGQLVGSTGAVNKTFKMYLDTSAFIAGVITTFAINPYNKPLRNLSATKQICSNNTQLTEIGGSTINYYAVNTGIDRDIKSSVTIASANEFLSVANQLIQVYPS